MELRQLRYFSAICEAGSITRASGMLHVAQPALSRQINDLEEELGYRLLKRHSGGVEVTEAGKAFLADINRLISDLENARSRGAAIASGHEYRVRIGVVGDDNLAKFEHVFKGLTEYARLFPRATIKLKSHNTLESINRSIAESQIDVAFTYSGAQFRDHHSLMIQRETVVLAIPRSHPLAGRSMVAVEDLRDVSLVWHARSAAVQLYDQLMHDFRSRGVEPSIMFELENPHLALPIVRAGLGCAFVTSAVGLRNDLEGIVLRKVEGIDFSIELQLAWSGESEAACRFVEVYRSVVDGPAAEASALKAD